MEAIVLNKLLCDLWPFSLWFKDYLMYCFVEKRCKAPDEVMNGQLICTDNQYGYLSDCILQCNAGFRPEGSLWMQCEADQSWFMVAEPQCIGMYHYTNIS